MAPPTNISIVTAIDITALPYSFSQRVDDAGTTYTVYFKFTADRDMVIGPWFFGDLTTYKPLTNVVDASEALLPPWNIAVTNLRMMVPLRAGQTAYFKVEPNAGNPSPANLTVDVQPPPTSPIEPGDLIILDDSGGPAAVLDPATGQVKRFLYPFASSELGDVLKSGEMLAADNATGQLVLYDKLGNVINATVRSYTGVTEILACGVYFYVFAGGTAYRYSATGVLVDTVATGLGTVAEGALSPDGATLYYTVNSTFNQPVKRHDLNANTPLSDLVAGDALYRTLQLMALADGSVVVAYHRSSTDYAIKRFDASGALLGTYAPGTTLGAGAVGDMRLDRTAADPATFLFWMVKPDGVSALQTIAASTMTLASEAEGQMFESGYDSGPVTATPPAAFGHSESCPLMTARGTPAVPIPAAQDPSAEMPCTPDTQVNGGGTGASGCNEGGLGWTPDYSGPDGDVPQHADPTPGEVLTINVPIDIWAELDLVDYPSGDVTTMRRSLTELADDPSYFGGRKPAGLVAVGDLEHGLGNETGAFEAGSADIEWSDAIDRTFRDLLASQVIDGCECRVYAASRKARRAGAAPRLLFRGIVQQTQFGNPLKAQLSVVDALFAEGGPLGPDRNFPPLIPADIFTTAPPDMSTKALPWLYGEKSDKGAVDPITNLGKEKGLCPLLYVGKQPITTSQWVQAPTTGAPVSEAVTALGQTGTPGSITAEIHSYVTCVKGGVEGPLSPEGGNIIRLQNGVPDSQLPHGIRVNWGQVAGVDSYRIYIFWGSSLGGNEAVGFNPLTGTWLNGGTCRVFTHDNATLDGFLNGEPWGDMQVQVHDPTDGAPYTAPFNADSSGSVGGSYQPVSEEWDAYIAFGHPVFRLIDVFGSDLGSGDPSATHDRVKLDINARGDIMVPGYTNWPYPTSYLEYVSPTDGTVYWLTMIFAKGPLSDDHKKGVVNMTCNAIGRMDDTGLPLRHYHRCEQSFFENEVFGYWTSGAQASTVTYPQFADGTAKVRSSRFLARQLYTADKLGASSALGAGVGLTSGWYMDTAKPILEHVKALNDGSETRIGVNGFGQITLGYVDERLDPIAWPRVRHVNDLFGPITWSFGEQRENPVRGVADWDADKGKFRIEKDEEKDPVAYAKFKNRWKPGDILELVTLNWQLELAWVLKQRLARLAEGETIGHVSGPVTLLNNDVDGDGILLTTIEGYGDGFVDQEMEIRRRSLGISSRLVTYTLRDLSKTLLTALYGDDALARVPLETAVIGDGVLQTNDPALAPLELA